MRKLILSITLFILSAGMSYYLFSQNAPKKVISVQPSVKNLAGGTVQFDQKLPKTEACPLNGTLYSKQQRSWWEKHRPLGVMIENHQDARPQSGLSFADIVYEAVAEGGITRFLAIYYCQDATVVGPVRSARTYFVDWVSEYADYPLYAHVGGANAPGPADALGQIESYGWNSYNDLNQFSIGFPTYIRDYDRLGRTVATEHTMYSSTTKLWKIGEERGLTNVNRKGTSWDANFVNYSFKDDAPNKSANQTIHIEFWQGGDTYNVDWIYDQQSNMYRRNNGGVSHLDLDTKKQLNTKNIVVMFMQESGVNDGYENDIHRLYQDKGIGKAVIFMDGKQIKGSWKKTSRTDRTLIYDANGNQVQFDRGVIWFTTLPLDGVLRVQ